VAEHPFKLAACLVALAFAFIGDGAGAQSSRTVKIVVPYPPASGPDILSRMMADQIGHAKDGPTVVVENRPGGGTVIGNEAVARAAPDGNTVLLAAPSFAISPALKRGNYDVVTSFEPVCNLASTPMPLVVRADSPYKTINDLIADAKAKPGKVIFSSGGPASTLHLAIEVLRRAAGLDITYVPYPGTAPAINALMGGHVNAVWADYPTVVSQLKSGTLRGLVTSSEKRVATMPDVPTLIETGIVKYTSDIFYGIVAPAKTPAAELAKLSSWFSAAIRAPELQPKLAQQGLFPLNQCGAAFGEFIRNTAADYARIIREANITVK
jgi:tripartite-type tricarboxylate transporter receptor subunit TctC